MALINENINQKIKKNQNLLLGLIVIGGAIIAAILWFFNDKAQNRPTETVFEDEAEIQPDLTGAITSTFDGKVGSQLVTDLQSETRDMRAQMAQISQQLEDMSNQLKEKNKENEEMAKQIAELQNDVINNMATNTYHENFIYENTATTTKEERAATTATPGKNVVVNSADSAATSTTPSNYGTMTYSTNTAPYSSNTTIIPTKGAFQRKTFTKKRSSSDDRFYVPSGAFSNAIILEGADANASVTAQDTDAKPMLFKLTGQLHLPANKKLNKLKGCFVTAATYGDISSERAIVRLKRLSCIINGKHIDKEVQGHVAFYGKNGIKGEPVMRNGKILGLAFGAGFLSSAGNATSQIGNTQVGLGASRTVGADEVLRQGIGGGVSSAANKLADYYIQRAEQYHPIIPIGSANRVEVVFNEGFWAEYIEDIQEKADSNVEKKQLENNENVKNQGLPDDLVRQLGSIQNMNLNDFVTPSAQQK